MNELRLGTTLLDLFEVLQGNQNGRATILFAGNHREA